MCKYKYLIVFIKDEKCVFNFTNDFSVLRLMFPTETKLKTLFYLNNKMKMKFFTILNDEF